MSFRWYLLAVIIATMPVVTNAAIIINEVAWMGNATSANDEWIELFNSGSEAVAVDGWVLSDGMNLEIALSGSIEAGQYAVLERTDDSSAPGSSFLIYTGAIPNTGATLTLHKQAGTIEDQVAGGEDWSNIGGDNVTKETAQFTSSGWITAEATPGSPNQTVSSRTVESNNEDGDDTSGQSTAKSTSVTVSKKSTTEKIEVSLKMEIEAPKQTYVHQPVTIKAQPSGLGKVFMQSLKYEWNFGDLTTGFGKEIQHQYDYPGQYVVVVRAKFADYNEMGRYLITVLPTMFSITKNTAGDIQINNNAKYEIDISGYKIQGNKRVIFPAETYLLAGSTLTIPKEKLITNPYSTVGLYDQANSLVASDVTVPKTETKKTVVNSTAPPVYVGPRSDAGASLPKSQQFDFSSEAQASSTAVSNKSKGESFSGVVPTSTQSASAIQANSVIPTDKLPYLGLIGIISIAMLSLYAGRNVKTEES